MYGGAYTWTIFCVSNKQASHKQENEHELKTRLDFAIIKLRHNDCIAYCLLRFVKLLFSNALPL